LTKRKLQHFAELGTFPNVIQSATDYDLKDHPIKGNWNKDFFKNNQPIVLELGCGKGEYSINLAKKYPDRNFIGIDIKGNRLWKGSKTALDEKITNVGFLRIQIERIEYFFAPNEVSEIWITFPDPQPKYKTEPKRLTSKEFLDRYRKILMPGGTIHLKTDNRPLHDYTLEILNQQKINPIRFSEDIYRDFPDDELLNISTTYEKLFFAKGFPITYISFRL
jgi:tRNA (guanine-N7-)-methyltransferase